MPIKKQVKSKRKKGLKSKTHKRNASTFNKANVKHTGRLKKNHKRGKKAFILTSITIVFIIFIVWISRNSNLINIVRNNEQGSNKNGNTVNEASNVLNSEAKDKSQNFENKKVEIPQGALYIDYLGLNLDSIQIVYFEDMALLRVPDVNDKEYLLKLDNSQKIIWGKAIPEEAHYYLIIPHQTIDLYKDKNKVTVLFNGDTIFRGIDKTKTHLPDFVSKAEKFIRNSEWFDTEYKNLRLKGVKANEKCKSECYLLTYEYDVLTQNKENDSDVVKKYNVVILVNDKETKLYKKPHIVE